MPEARRIKTLQEHQAADRVPAMSEEEYAGLLDDIAEHGIEVPLEITSRGAILDGRHRLRAARDLGLASVPVRIVAPKDEVEHVLRKALHRRHLTPSQKAALAVELDEVRVAASEATLRRRANLTEVATLPLRGRTRDLAARIAGVSPRLVQDVETVRTADPELFAQIKAGNLPAHRAAQRVRRAERYGAMSDPPALPSQLFDLIYADPPWQLGNPYSDYAPENHYPTLPLAEIKALPIPAAEDALLFLWAPCSILPGALEVIVAWGFEFRTTLVWVKDRIGLGRWVRHRHEHLLLARRGNFPIPEDHRRPDSVIEAPRARHSEKPALVYELIERMYPRASRLELFARSSRPGWTGWGNEAAA